MFNKIDICKRIMPGIRWHTFIDYKDWHLVFDIGRVVSLAEPSRKIQRFFGPIDRLETG